jgi:hypothetical protein
VRKTSLFTIFFIALFYLFHNFDQPVYSYSLELLASQCSAGEEKAVCVKEPLVEGYLYRNSCKRYEVSPSYYLLTEIAGTDNVSKVFCRLENAETSRVKAFLSEINYLVSSFLAPLLFFVLMVELPIFFKFGFRTRKQVSTVIYMNFISITLINLTMFMINYTGPALYVLSLVFSVLFEAGVLLTFYRSVTMSNSIKGSAVANFFSYVATAAFLMLFSKAFLSIWV